MSYQFKNKTCPKCGKSIDPYHYAFVNGKKYCIGCEP